MTTSKKLMELYFSRLSSILRTVLLVSQNVSRTFLIIWDAGAASPYVPGVPGHTQFLAQIRVKTYVGTPSFLHGHTQFLSLNILENAGAHPLSKT